MVREYYLNEKTVKKKGGGVRFSAQWGGKNQKMEINTPISLLALILGWLDQCFPNYLYWSFVFSNLSWISTFVKYNKNELLEKWNEKN